VVTPSQPAAVLAGVVERIIFLNEENHYTIAEFRPETKPAALSAKATADKKEKPGIVTITGALPGVECGETLHLTGEWTRHAQHGDQFKVAAFRSELPASVYGIRKYLGSGLVPGIGKVYAEEFAKAGARVVAADIDGAAAQAVAEALTAQGLQAAGLATDIASEASTAVMAQAALDRFGAIDVLINNASLMSVLPRRSWLEIPVEEWDRVMAVNLRGMFLSCRAVFPAMQAGKRGKIVNISSSRVWEGTPNRLHYTTSKAGVIGFTRALAREVGEFGITVNAVTPGNTQSETQVQSSSGNYLAARVAGRAIERVQVPADLVGAVMFLSSAASDFMTGQTINVDGGKAMH